PSRCPFRDHPNALKVWVGGHERDAAGDERAAGRKPRSLRGSGDTHARRPLLASGLASPLNPVASALARSMSTVVESSLMGSGESIAPSPSKYDWARLSRLQVGRYGEYFAKMEFTL